MLHYDLEIVLLSSLCTISLRLLWRHRSWSWRWTWNRATGRGRGRRFSFDGVLDGQKPTKKKGERKIVSKNNTEMFQKCLNGDFFTETRLLWKFSNSEREIKFSDYYHRQEVMFTPVFVWFSPGYLKTYLTDFHQSLWMGSPNTGIQSIKCWLILVEIGGAILKRFSVSFSL